MGALTPAQRSALLQIREHDGMRGNDYGIQSRTLGVLFRARLIERVGLEWKTTDAGRRELERPQLTDPQRRFLEAVRDTDGSWYAVERALYPLERVSGVPRRRRTHAGVAAAMSRLFDTCVIARLVRRGLRSEIALTELGRKAIEP